jgi:hypothetical protein
MKTAMQELIDELKEHNRILVKEGIEPNPSVRMYQLKAEKLLEKEKEQIIEAYEQGYKACDLDEALEINKTMFSGNRYYEITYGE